MGARVAALARADRRFQVAAGVVGRASEPSLEFPLIAENELRARLPKADVFIDFSTADASVRYAELAARERAALVTGTTGRTRAQEEALRGAAKRTAVFAAANFSPGMSVLLHLARQAAKALPSWDAAVLDVHHKAKKDAPSGTAKLLAEASATEATPRPETASLRLGDVVGDHVLTLAGSDERIELGHRAHSRDVFARGALEAALWLKGRKPGLYGMRDLLGLEG